MSEQVVIFPQGLVGCEAWKRFVLVESAGEPIQQLMCLDEPEVSFLIAEAEAIAPGYRLQLSDADRRLLDGPDQGEAQVLCTLTVRREAPAVTANLLGPLVINRANGIGKQVVLVNSGYSARHPVLERVPEGAHAGPH